MSTPAVLAIVGTRQYVETRFWPAAEALADAIYNTLRPGIEADGGKVISGGAPGIDTLARARAALAGWTPGNGKFTEYLPEHPRWEPDGYKARDLQIARDCTHLVRIACRHPRTYGSGWTADRAEGLGKNVRRYVWVGDLGRFVEQGEGL